MPSKNDIFYGYLKYNRKSLRIKLTNVFTAFNIEKIINSQVHYKLKLSVNERKNTTVQTFQNLQTTINSYMYKYMNEQTNQKFRKCYPEPYVSGLIEKKKSFNGEYEYYYNLNLYLSKYCEYFDEQNNQIPFTRFHKIFKPSSLLDVVIEIDNICFCDNSLMWYPKIIQCKIRKLQDLFNK